MIHTVLKRVYGRARQTWRAGLVLLASASLIGCASTVTSEVTAFRQADWVNEASRTYAFESVASHSGERAANERAGDLERRTYQDWISRELQAHGFTEAARPQARYVVGFEYDATPRTIRIRETVYPEPYFPGPFSRPWPGWGPYGGWGWPGYWPPYMVERDVAVTQHALRLSLTEARGGKRVYQVTAQHESTSGVHPAVIMPYLIRSAFVEFPARSGQPRQVTLPVEK